MPTNTFFTIKEYGARALSAKKHLHRKFYFAAYIFKKTRDLMWPCFFITSWLFFPPRQIENPDYPPGQWDKIIEGQEFISTLSLDTGDDNTLIIGAVFYDIDDHALMIRNVSNIYIKDCIIYNIDGFGILLRSTGSTQNITIDGCTIYNTRQSGIHAAQQPEKSVTHTNLIIKNNTIYNSGKTEQEHNIYVQSAVSLIENNTVYESSGNGISIRSSGTVRGNTIWNAAKSCIRYFNDHTPGTSNTLLIENNICHLTTPGLNNSPAISLLAGKENPLEQLVQKYTIRFNTIVSFTATRYGFKVESPEFDDKQIEVYGNLIVNTQDIEKALHAQYIDYLSDNYTATSLEGFVNSSRMPYDFRLTAQSPVQQYVVEEANYPAVDIDGNTRVARCLNAGAAQSSGNLTECRKATNQQLWVLYLAGTLGIVSIITATIIVIVNRKNAALTA